MREMNTTEMALTQCQHISHDATVELEGGDLVDPMERAKSALERIREVAETGEADPSFVAMLVEADEPTACTVDPRTPCPIPDAGAMSASEPTAEQMLGDVEEEAARIALTAVAGDEIDAAVERAQNVLLANPEYAGLTTDVAIKQAIADLEHYAQRLPV